MRNKIDEQIDRLNLTLTEMGALTESSILQAVEAFVKQDADAARRAVKFDEEVDKKEKEIEHMCFNLLLKQHPVAGDLRFVSAALKMITDMERIGDQAADISEITIQLAGQAYIKKAEHIPQMAREVGKMVTGGVDAFVRRDLSLAREVMKRDDTVDELFTKVRDDLIGLIRADASNGAQAIDLMMIAKYFERIGDHAVNIAEWVAYSLTGTHGGEERPG